MNRIKVVEYTEAWTPGGIESYIINIMGLIDKEKFDVVVWPAQIYADLFDEDIEKLGIKLYSPVQVEQYINPLKRTINAIRIFRNTVRELNCDVMHLHAANGVAWIYAYIAKKNGVKKLIFHAHASEMGEGKRFIKYSVHNVCKCLFWRNVDMRVACSEKAAEFLYTNNVLRHNDVKYINCIIDVDRFRFNSEVRKLWRKDNRVDDQEIIFLHIGRFQYQKNHHFLLEMFNEITSVIPSKLYLIGEGKAEQEIRDHISSLGLDEKVIIVGKTREVEKYMWMSDVFLLPSNHEGNPIVTAEAQASGLTCYISDRVTKRAKLLDSSKYIGIENPKSSAGIIINDYEKKSWSYDRVKSADVVLQRGYDKYCQIQELQEMYSSEISE